MPTPRLEGDLERARQDRQVLREVCAMVALGLMLRALKYDRDLEPPLDTGREEVKRLVTWLEDTKVGAGGRSNPSASRAPSETRLIWALAPADSSVQNRGARRIAGLER